MGKGGRPPKRAKDQKGQTINVRVTREEKGALSEAARSAGMGVSTWLVMLGLREARKSASSKSQ